MEDTYHLKRIKPFNGDKPSDGFVADIDADDTKNRIDITVWGHNASETEVAEVADRVLMGVNKDASLTTAEKVLVWSLVAVTFLGLYQLVQTIIFIFSLI